MFSSPGRKDLTPSVFPHRKGAGFPALDHLHNLPLDPFQSVPFFLELWEPELDAGLQVQHDKRLAEWDDHASVSLGHVPADAAQDLIRLCCCSRTLLTHVQLLGQQQHILTYTFLL